MTPKHTPKKYKALCSVGFGYGETPDEALAALRFMNPGVPPSSVVVKGITFKNSGNDSWYVYDRVVELDERLTTHVFACLSGSGILMYAERHADLADALIGYAKEVSIPIDGNLVNDCTWYEFDAPPKNWTEWSGDMAPEDYDVMSEAAGYEHRGADEAVVEALARLEGGAR